MGTEFAEIYDMFLYSLRSDDIIINWEIDPVSIESMLKDYLFESADLNFTECIKDLSKRDETSFEEELSNEEKRILALGMKIKYISSNLLTREKEISQHFFTKDYKVFSPANKLKVLIELEEKERSRFRNSKRVYQYNALMNGDNSG